VEKLMLLNEDFYYLTVPPEKGTHHTMKGYVGNQQILSRGRWRRGKSESESLPGFL
jgi:hypothetical protein